MNRFHRLSRRTRPAFLLAPVAFAAAVSAQGLPTGGQVVAGRGSIAASGSGLVVTQNTQRMVADWASFSIDAGRSVRFVQPSSTSVALNRVTGGDASRIFGNLVANGHVYLQNPNGVLFGAGAQVSVGSLVATTLNVDRDDFLDGRLRMAGGEAGAELRNDGTIRVAAGGHAVLAGPRVTNRGAISAPGGTVALAAGAAVEVDATGAGLLSVRVPVAAVQAQLANRGTLVADGGEVQLRAAAADAALATVKQVGGVVRARSVEAREGRIVLSGGASGVVRVDGTLDARGGAGLDGGSVAVRGERIALVGAARIDASGGSGGGTVTVGGEWQGRAGGESRDAGLDGNARDAIVGGDVQIDASARELGDAGTVVVWSDGNTRFAGSIAARGGAQGGDGGQVEVSGKGWLGFEGKVDTRAANGRQGMLLLDPQVLIVGATANINGDSIPGDDFGPAFNPLNDTLFGAVTSNITATSVASLLFTTSVTLQATNSLQIAAPLTVAAGGAASTLTLNAPVMAINAAMTLNNTALVANTRSNLRDSIAVNANVSSARSVSLTSSLISIDANIAATTLNLAVPAGVAGAILQTGGSIDATTLNVTHGAGSTLGVDLSARSNQLRTVNIDADAASVGVGNAAGTGLVLNASDDVTLAGVGGGDVVVDAGGRFTLGGDLSGDDITITSVGFQNGAQAALLPSAGNRFLVRSSDWTLDTFGTIVPGTGATNLNFVVYGGWTGALPATGNGYVTNRTASIAAPNADAPDISRVYDGSTAFAYVQTGASAQANGQDTAGGAVALDSLSDYTVTTTGSFADRNVGTDKAYTVAGTNDVVATGSSGVAYYGLRFSGYTRAAGPLTRGAPGGVVSEVTPRSLTLTGLDGVDRVYDGTVLVELDTSGVALGGLVAGDAVTLSTSGADARVADKNVGVDKAVGVTGLALAGADAINYRLVDASTPTATITRLALTASGIRAFDKVFDGSTAVTIDTSGASVAGVLAGDVVVLDASGATGAVDTPDAGIAKAVTVDGLLLSGADAQNYSVLAVPVAPGGGPLAVRILTPAQAAFEEIRYKAYLQGLSDAQEPFRRAMAEALAAGFGRENIRKPLSRGLVFETGLAAPAVDRIEPARAPAGCAAAGAGLACRP
jgi:filamentous hemagglutinin family protein